MTDELLPTFAELNPVADPDRLVALDASDLPADPVLRTLLEHARTNNGRPDPVRSVDVHNPRSAHTHVATQGGTGDMQTTEVRPDRQQTVHRRPKTLAAVGAVAAVILAVIAGLVVVNDRGSAPVVSPGDDRDQAPVVSAGNVGGEAAEVLTGFLEARIAGEGAQQYLNVPEEDIPLLYATTSGAAYERAEFEPVRGIEWPHGSTAFKVRLFAGDTVIEQLFFTGRDTHYGPLQLEYDPHGFATHIAPTTENGQAVALRYDLFDGQVTLRAAHPWVFSFGTFGRLIPEGPGVRPTTDGGQRNDWDSLMVLADPVPVGTDCQSGPRPADAAALAESMRSDPGLDTTGPVAVSVGGTRALVMDVVIPAGARVCTSIDPSVENTEPADIELRYFGIMGLIDDREDTDVHDGVATASATGDWMRLYLFDMPDGSSMRTMAIAIIASESTFERAVEAAAPVVDSVEFHAT